MKRLVTPLIAIFVVFSLVSCKPSKEEAVKYNDKIIDEQVAITQKIEALNKSFKTWNNADTMDLCWVNALDQTEKSLKKVSEMEKFHGNSQLRDGAIALFKVYRSVINVEFREMVGIYKMPDELYGKDQELKWTNLSDEAFNKLDKAIGEMSKVQQSFAKEFGFQIDNSQK
jgi:hypothetical protein